MSDKKRSRTEEPKSDPLDGKYSLEGTRYAGLQRQVQEMVRKQKGDVPSGGAGKNKHNKRNTDLKKRPSTQSKEVREDKRESEKPTKKSRVEEREKISQSSVSSVTGPVDPKTEPFVNDNTVYVAGLPFTASEEEVRSFFSEAGQVLELR
ncbi:hypothetical protein EON64_00700, partial [archaeon]